MKKNLLLLLWMTLLPLAGWAGDVTVTLGTINKAYGEADPALTENNFSIVTSESVTKAEILSHLTYKRVQPGDELNGSYEFTAVVDPSYTTHNIVVSNNGKVNVLAKNISSDIEVADVEGLVYDGEAKTPGLTVTYSSTNLGDLTLEEGTDYTVAWTNNTNAGTATATLTGIGKYEGTLTKDVTIAAAEFAAALRNPDATYTYDGQEHMPEFTVTFNGADLTENTDYTVTWPSDKKNAAEDLTITIAGINNFAGTSKNLKYTINPKSLTSEDITYTTTTNAKGTGTSPRKYTGEAQSIPGGWYSVIDGSTTLTKNTHYTQLAGGNNINAGSYKDEDAPYIVVKGKGNYEGELHIPFTILPRDITSNDDITATINGGEDITYTAVAQTPAVVIKDALATVNADLTAETDYTIGEEAWDANTDAGTAHVTITGTGNYTGTKTFDFTIGKATLTITPEDKSKNLGTNDPELTWTANWIGEAETLIGQPTVTRVSGESAGTYDITVNVAGITATNYNVVAGEKATFTINAAGITITPKAVAETYGYKLPALNKDAFEFTAPGLLDGESITALTYVVTDSEGNAKAEGDMLDAGTYTITPSAATATSDSYSFNYATAELTINPYQLIIRPAAQQVAYPAGDITKSTADLYVKIIGVENEAEVSFTKSTFNTKFGIAEYKPYFIESLVWEAEEGYEDKPIAHPGFIVANLTDTYNSANFTVDTDTAAVTYTGIADELTFKGDATDAATIAQYAGQRVNVSINFANRNGKTLGDVRNWTAENWHTMVLPFDISVADLSKILGYAIVNVIDPDKTVFEGDQSKFYGKLTMKGGNGGEDRGVLAANKPFMLKLADDIDTSKDYDFGEQEIVAPDDMSVDAGKGCKFVGTYTTKTVTKDDNEMIWFQLGNYSQWAFIGSDSSASWDIVPFAAYIDMNQTTALSAPKKVTFYMQDINGSTTAITSISADEADAKLSSEGWYNLNGVKLNEAPTQKGIYIKDGKKVVIK